MPKDSLMDDVKSSVNSGFEIINTVDTATSKFQKGNRKGSIIKSAKQNIFEFPVFISSSVSLEYAEAASSLLEQTYASYLQMAISKNPVVNAADVKRGVPFGHLKTDIKDYLEYAEYDYMREACHNVIECDGFTLEFDRLSISDAEARAINEAVDYQPLSEFDHFFQEAKSNRGSGGSGGNNGGNNNNGNRGNRRNDPYKKHRRDNGDLEFPTVTTANGKEAIDLTKYQNLIEKGELPAPRDLKDKDRDHFNRLISHTIDHIAQLKETADINQKNAATASSQMEVLFKQGAIDAVKKMTDDQLGKYFHLNKKEIEDIRNAGGVTDKKAVELLGGNQLLSDCVKLHIAMADKELKENDVANIKTKNEILQNDKILSDVEKAIKNNPEYIAAQKKLNTANAENAEILRDINRFKRDAISGSDNGASWAREEQQKHKADASKAESDAAIRKKDLDSYDADKRFERAKDITNMAGTAINSVSKLISTIDAHKKTKQDIEKLKLDIEQKKKDLEHYEEDRERNIRKTEAEIKHIAQQDANLRAVKAPEFIDDAKLQKMNTMRPMLMSVQLSVLSDSGDVSQPINYIVGVKMYNRIIDADILPEVAEYPLKEMDKISRKVKWRAGELKFMKDIVFRIKQKKQTAADAKDPNRKWYRRLYELAHMQGDAASAAVVRGDSMIMTFIRDKQGREKLSHGLLPNVSMMISKSDVDNVKMKTKIDLLKGSTAKKFCKELFLMGLVVMDTDAESIKLLCPDLHADYEVHSLGSVKKQMSMLDTVGTKTRDMFKVLG